MTTQLPALPDISDVRPVGETDQDVFAEIRAVLEKHDALQRFGVTLLHQHFPMADGEVLVESIDVENRTLTQLPKNSSSPHGVETSWRLDDPTGQRQCEVICEPVPQRFGGGHRRNHYTTG